MGNNWKQIWEKRQIDETKLERSDINKLFLELKRANGFDVMDGGIPLDSLLGQYAATRAKLLEHAPAAKSVFEIGCGSGANLLLFEHDGWKTGGLDYSGTLVDIARKVLKSDDLTCANANTVAVDPQYDCLLSNSVFSYFQDYAYAEEVLKRMYQKAGSAIVLIDIHDAAKKEDFIRCRKEIVADYEERYRDLPKLFYEKAFFEKFARKYNLAIEFYDSDMKGYWNNEFVFHLAMFKQ